MSTLKKVLSTVLLSFATTTAACGASEPAAEKPTVVPSPAPVVKSSGGDPYDLCVAMFERQRACTDAFIPALVDARVRADVPAGIAAKDESEGRDALVALALEEWKGDSTDDAIAATCRKVAEHATPELESAAQGCLDIESCDAFATCAVDLASSQWR